MALRPSTVSQRVPLPSPPASSLPVLADPESDSLRAASPTVAHLLSTVFTDPSFEPPTASALVAELVDFAACCRLDYAAGLVAESASVCPPSCSSRCSRLRHPPSFLPSHFCHLSSTRCHPDRRASLSLRPSRSCPSLLRPPLPFPCATLCHLPASR
ncbi:unnamed protein product [Closterium sp. NIES-53]